MKKILTIGCLLLCCSDLPALGDILIIENTGNTIVPMDETEISMDAETVRMEPAEILSGYRVYCEFTLSNHSDKTITKDVAFPISDRRYRWHMAKDFKVTVERNGITEPLPTELAMNDDTMGSTAIVATPSTQKLNYPGYIIWKQSFFAKETIKVRCEYLMGEPAGIWPRRPFSGIEFKYIVKTGALWKGPIGKAEIKLYLKIRQSNHKSFGGLEPIKLTDLYSIHMDENSTLNISHSDHAKWATPAKDELIWSFEDWEPTEDIFFAITDWSGYETNQIAQNGYLLPTPYKGRDLEYKEEYLTTLTNLEKQRVRKYYPSADFDADFIKSMISSFLLHEIFARHGESFAIAPYSEENLSKYQGEWSMHNDDYIYGEWNSYFSPYGYHGGWYHPQDNPVALDELNPVEKKNVAFLVQFVRNEFVHRGISKEIGLKE